jgi:ribosome-associated protein
VLVSVGLPDGLWRAGGPIPVRMPLGLHLMADFKNKMNTRSLTSAPQDGLPARTRRKTSPALPQDDVAHTAAGRANTERVAKALERSKIAARIADDNRAKDILLLDLRQATPLIDFFVIASANSRRQANAIASEIDVEMKKLGEAKLGMEGTEEGRWILVDYGDFVIHIFSEDARGYYALEEIWGDAERVEWRDPARIKLVAPPVEADESVSEDE